MEQPTIKTSMKGDVSYELASIIVTDKINHVFGFDPSSKGKQNKHVFQPFNTLLYNGWNLSVCRRNNLINKVYETK